VANVQPVSNPNELAEAARIAGIKPNEVAHGSMPPFITKYFRDGTSHRILNVYITSPNSNRTVHVNMNTKTVESPPRPAEEPLACTAPPPFGGPNSGRGIPGSATFNINNGLWTFQAIRPSTSSGTRGSGIELRNVKYKGKTVLFQAHVPILNVEYEQTDTGCGPFYRDWQWDEWTLQCNLGPAIGPGFRWCTSPAKTIVDSPHVDGGNFLGVAVYTEGQEVVLKSQMTAGWYRYVTEWRFHLDGTLRPRFGFGGVQWSAMCVCKIHHHHVYWRLDFDIESAGNNVVREVNNPPSNFDFIYETKRPKANGRRWEVANTRTNNAYTLIPGSNDGASSAFGVGDLWVLGYHSNEIDDGQDNTVVNTQANLDKFITNGETVKDRDVVLWYAAHFRHVETLESPEGGKTDVSHVVGPDIRVVKWV
jgi:hypothetical protein